MRYIVKFLFIVFIISNIFIGQIYAIQHMAEHGFEEHEHNEQPCELSIYCENYKFINITNDIFYDSISLLNLNDIVNKLNFVFIIKHNKQLSRAPPTIS
jgi:hypothetical protein